VFAARVFDHATPLRYYRKKSIRVASNERQDSNAVHLRLKMRSRRETSASAGRKKRLFFSDPVLFPSFIIAGNRDCGKDGRVPHVGPATVDERQSHVSPFAGRSVLTKRRPLLDDLGTRENLVRTHYFRRVFPEALRGLKKQGGFPVRIAVRFSVSRLRRHWRFADSRKCHFSSRAITGQSWRGVTPRKREREGKA